MFSNFLSARHVEEKEKLTYLYLSMIERGALDEQERKIILQSLLSRSDTGLLKKTLRRQCRIFQTWLANKDFLLEEYNKIL